MQVHLVDGTYELFRAFYGVPERIAPGGREVGATLALGRTLLSLLGNEGASPAPERSGDPPAHEIMHNGPYLQAI